MEDDIIFLDKGTIPPDQDLAKGLNTTIELWIQIQNHTMSKYPQGVPEWFFASKKSGWAFRIKDKKRAILYLLPRDKYFKVSFVFGQKSMDVVLGSNVSEEIKNSLLKATPYAEGRGIQIVIKDSSKMSDIQKLIEIKIEN